MEGKGLAVVSGAGGGIGRAISARLRAEGHEVAMLGRDRAKLEAARDDIGSGRGLHLLVVDLADGDSLSSAVASIGLPVTALVHAAGNGPVGRLSETTDAMWLDTIDGKLLGAVRLVRSILPSMQRPSPAGIVFVDGAFVYEPDPLFIINGAVNCALAGLSKALSRELIQDGIRVNTVHPGATSTRLWDDTAADLAPRLGMSDGATVTRAIGATLLAGRITSPEDVADAVAFLLSTQARHITGSSLTVDGGAIRSLV